MLRPTPHAHSVCSARPGLFVDDLGQLTCFRLRHRAAAPAGLRTRGGSAPFHEARRRRLVSRGEGRVLDADGRPTFAPQEEDAPIAATTTTSAGSHVSRGGSVLSRSGIIPRKPRRPQVAADEDHRGGDDREDHEQPPELSGTRLGRRRGRLAFGDGPSCHGAGRGAGAYDRAGRRRKSGGARRGDVSCEAIERERVPAPSLEMRATERRPRRGHVFDMPRRPRDGIISVFVVEDNTPYFNYHVTISVCHHFEVASAVC